MILDSHPADSKTTLDPCPSPAHREAVVASKPKRPPAPRRPTELELHASVEKTRMVVTGLTILGSILGLCLLVLAAVPLAHVIAGKKTDFEVNVTLSLSIMFGITSTIGGGFAYHYRRANQRLRGRSGQLEAELDKTRQNVTRLEQELSDAHGRIQDLEAVVE